LHEVSLMRNLLNIVGRAAAAEGAGSVSVIHLRIGEMSGVSTEALNFAFQVLSEGTVAEGGRLEFEKVPFEIKCKRCGNKAKLKEFVFHCDRCGSREIEIVSGREMEVDYILTGEDDKDEGKSAVTAMSKSDGGKSCIR
jgi:hydrogenase nickel incorporation protein HypA/HybF